MALLKCIVCGVESKALHMHMKSHILSKGKDVEDKEYVSSKDLEDYKKETDEKLDRILNIITSKEEPIIHAGGVQAEQEEFKGNVGNLPLQFQAVFMKHFDPNDGFTAEYDPIENTFDIIIPPKFSNAITSNLEYYKIDRRRKKLEATNPLATIDSWCVKVVKNLRYQKNVALKQ
jgi:hypothetical protein